MGHRLAPEARTDLDDLWFYIATNSSAENADRVVESLTKRSLPSRGILQARVVSPLDLRTMRVAGVLTVEALRRAGNTVD